ncbi:hypothetical protein [Bowmanella sp. JS7-9]|uniref:PEP-CTERM protein-sorting domain-containing protein n=1 Tax=Pseudobowmanella zhangzhouensis TaxID=1537679 RepID=A0ABW1XGU4_9ALTE|nr:hypothetical protein [Bowmanella sp. JS7-9]
MKRISILILLFFSKLSGASFLHQTFDSTWNVKPYEYSDQVSAWAWSYNPYQVWEESFGVLEEVSIRISVTGEKSVSDSLSIRAAFFTGWNPADYQFSTTLQIEEGIGTFSRVFEWTFNGYNLGNWLSYDYLPQAHYYFESRTSQSPHFIQAATTLTFGVLQVSEPSTLWLLVSMLYLGICAGSPNKVFKSPKQRAGTQTRWLGAARSIASGLRPLKRRYVKRRVSA